MTGNAAAWLRMLITLCSQEPPTIPCEGVYEDTFHCGCFEDMQFLIVRLEHHGSYTYAILVVRYVTCIRSTLEPAKLATCL